MDSDKRDSFAQRDRHERSVQIRNMNDQLRMQHRGGQLVVTHGVCSLGQPYVPAMIRAVTAFDDFTQDNDPHGEHDFGALEVLGHRIFWKIDYYDRDMKYGSPDPADPSCTTRLLTIMLASEY